MLKMTLCRVGLPCAVLLAVSACTDNSSGLPKEAAMVSVQTESFAHAEDFFSGSKYVILETSDSCLLHGQTKFHTSDKYIVAYSPETGFCTFTMDGKLAGRFSHFGQGPGEYLNVSDFYVKGEEIWCMLLSQKKIVTYNISTGNLGREIALPDIFCYMAPLGSSLMVMSPAYSNRMMYNFSVLNLDGGNIVDNYMEYDVCSSRLFDDFNAFVGEDEECVYATLPFDHTLYRIDPNGCAPFVSYSFDTPDRLPEDDQQTRDLGKIADDYRLKRVVKWLGPYAKVFDDVCFQSFSLMCDYGILPFLCRYSPDGGEVKTLRIGAERFAGYPYLTVPPFEFSSGYYVCSMTADRVLIAENILGDTTFSDAGLTEESNPVIFFYKLRDS